MSEEVLESESTPAVSHRPHRDWVGTIVGLGIFLVGIWILYTVFSLALDQFRTPPRVEMSVQAGKPIQVSSAFNGIYGVFVKVLLLILMTWVGSVIANRGIHLYSHSRMGRKS